MNTPRSEIIDIRRARESEAAIITDLKMTSKKSNGYTDEFMDACRDELSVSERDIQKFEIWVATLNDKIVGMLDIQLGEHPGVLEALFIDPAVKGHGIGRLLFQKCLERAKQGKAREIVVDSDPEAREFYEKMGMRKTGEIPSGSIAGRFLPRMSLKLT